MEYTSCNGQIPMIMPKELLKINLFSYIFDFENLKEYFDKFKHSRTRISLWVGYQIIIYSNDGVEIFDKILSMNLNSLQISSLNENNYDISPDFDEFLLSKKEYLMTTNTLRTLDIDCSQKYYDFLEEIQKANPLITSIKRKISSVITKYAT